MYYIRIMKFSTLCTVAMAAVLLGCATTPEQKLAKAFKVAAKTPFDQCPVLYKQQLAQGLITESTYKSWMDAWNKENVRVQVQVNAQRRLAERRQNEYDRMLASLTPAQRLDLAMRERELKARYDQMNLQQQQQRNAAIAAGLYDIQQTWQQQQCINAYNARTQVLSQPRNVNVNHSGYINVYHQ